MTTTRAVVALAAAAALSSGCAPLPYPEDPLYYGSPAGWHGEGWSSDYAWTERYPLYRSAYHAPAYYMPSERWYEDRVVYYRAPRGDSGRGRLPDRHEGYRSPRDVAGHSLGWNTSDDDRPRHDHDRAQRDRQRGDRDAHDTHRETRSDYPSHHARGQDCVERDCSARWRERAASHPHPRRASPAAPSSSDTTSIEDRARVHATDRTGRAARDSRPHRRRDPDRPDQIASAREPE